MSFVDFTEFSHDCVRPSRSSGVCHSFVPQLSVVLPGLPDISPHELPFSGIFGILAVECAAAMEKVAGIALNGVNHYVAVSCLERLFTGERLAPCRFSRKISPASLPFLNPTDVPTGQYLQSVRHIFHIREPVRLCRMSRDYLHPSFFIARYPVCTSR